VTNMLALAIWEGHEDKDPVDEYTEGVRQVTEKVGREGLELNPLADSEGEPLIRNTQVKWRGGGDMKWIQTVLGARGWSFSFCGTSLPRRIFTRQQPMSVKGMLPQLKALEGCYYLAHRFFGNERSFVCPGCREKFTRKGAISLDHSAKKYTPASHGSEHYGHTPSASHTLVRHRPQGPLHLRPTLPPSAYWCNVWKRFVVSRIYSLGLSLNRKRILGAGPYLRGGYGPQSKGVGQWQLNRAMQGEFAAKKIL
jgi:hypothetical protein